MLFLCYSIFVIEFSVRFHRILIETKKKNWELKISKDYEQVDFFPTIDIIISL